MACSAICCLSKSLPARALSQTCAAVPLSSSVTEAARSGFRGAVLAACHEGACPRRLPPELVCEYAPCHNDGQSAQRPSRDAANQYEYRLVTCCLLPRNSLAAHSMP